MKHKFINTILVVLTFCILFLLIRIFYWAGLSNVSRIELFTLYASAAVFVLVFIYKLRRNQKTPK